MSELGLPISGLHLRRIAELEQLVGHAHYQGWGRDGAAAGLFFVDVGDPGSVTRYRGETLHLAIGEALRRERAKRGMA